MVKELFLNHIRQHNLLKPHEHVLLTVSGGLDSMVMLHLFVTTGFKVSVAHCNFQLRGAESDGDEQFVSDSCQHLEVPFYTRRFDTNNYATQKGVSIQMAARELRYAWFNELTGSKGIEVIATAHHLNDSIETTLLNLISGRGIDGLTGIAVKNGNIIRPLLFATRAQIETYAVDHSIVWREDSSNQHDHYKRNFIRHQIIPRLKQLNPALEDSIQRSMLKNAAAGELALQGISSFRDRYVNNSHQRMAISKAGMAVFQYPQAVLYELVRGQGFTLEQCEQAIAALHGQSGKQFLTPTHQMTIDREEMIITAVSHHFLPDQVHIDEHQSKSTLGGWSMELVSSADCTITTATHHVSLDAGKIQFPLTWRPWHEGDYFVPLGMTNRKKVSDFLIDTKIALSDKAGVTVVVSKGEIIWVVGHRISHHFRITASTRRVLRLKVEPYFV